MYKENEIINVQVTFNEVVYVTGAPVLNINTKAGGRYIAYNIGHATNTLSFSYSVVSGDNSADLDYTATTALALFGSTIRDASLNDASLVLPTPGTAGSLGNNKDIVIDTTVPTIVAGYLDTNNAFVNITFSEGVYGTGGVGPISVNDIQMAFSANGGTASGAAVTALVSTSNGPLVGGETTVRAMISVTGEVAGNETVYIQPLTNTIFDKAGNVMSTSQTTGVLTLVKSGLTPVVTNIYAVSVDGTYGEGQTVNIAVTFSIDVNVTGIPFIQLETGSTDHNAFYANNINSNTLLFKYQVSAGDSSLDLDYHDAGALVSGLTLIKSTTGVAANVTLPTPGFFGSLSANSNIVIDTRKPVIDSVTTSTADGSYGVGVSIPIKLFVNRSVTLSGGNLLITMNSGAVVTVSSVNGTVISAIYITKAGDKTNDLNITSLSLSSGATIVDSQGTSLDLTLPVPTLANLHDIVIDAVALDFMIVSSTGTNGTISPLGSISVQSGATQKFDIVPNANYHIVDVLVDGASVGPLSQYFFTNVKANHTISASFALNNGFFNITANSSSGGTLSRYGNIKVASGENTEIFIFPDAGYHVSDVQIDGLSVGAVNSYKFVNVQGNHLLNAFFAKDSTNYLITANSIGQGKITPEGHQFALDGNILTFHMQASIGSHLREVIVDGKSVGAVSTYEFNDILDNHQILAVFEKTMSSYKIAASAVGGGSITPNKLVDVTAGQSKTFNFAPQNGYHLANVIVDGISKGPLTSYTFNNVNENHTIEAVYQKTKTKYSISHSINNGGFGAALSGAGNGQVDAGSALTLTVTAETGYYIRDIKVNSISIADVDLTSISSSKRKSFGSSVVYNISKVHSDLFVEVEVDKAKTNYTINVNTQGKGSVDVGKVLTVTEGNTQPLIFLPDAGYHVGEVFVNGVAIGPIQYLGLTDIRTNYEIKVIFAKDQSKYAVRSSVTGLGKISPNGETLVSEGDSASYTFTPNANYQLIDIIVDGISLKKNTGIGPRDGYQFKNINKNHTIDAVFEKVTAAYKITTTVGTGGTATNSGEVSVPNGSNHVIQISANAGFHVNNVMVDGKSIGAVTSYEFTNVISAHTVDIQFGANKSTYTITTTTGANGTAKPDTIVNVKAGESQLIEFVPDDGFRVLDVIINGDSNGSITSKLFRNVQRNQTITVTFIEADKPYNVAAEVVGADQDASLGIIAAKEGESVSVDYEPASASLVIKDVKIDGVSYGVLTSYTFTDVDDDHKIVYIVEDKNNVVDPGTDPIPDDEPTTGGGGGGGGGGCQYSANANNSNVLELLLLILLTFFCTRFLHHRRTQKHRHTD